MQAGLQGSVMIQWLTGSYNVAKDLVASGTDDAGKWMLLSISADLFSRDAGPPKNYDAITTDRTYSGPLSCCM